MSGEARAFVPDFLILEGDRLRDIPEQLADRYQIREKLGEGAFAQTFMAEDTRLGRTVAIKVLRPQFADDPEYAARFEREARSAAAVVHPNIVSVFEYGQEGSTLYLVMELVDGSDLKALVIERAPVDPATTTRIIGELLTGLATIHDAGIIHRDVKPQNVLIDRDGKAKLADFGIARRLADEGLTGTGIALGTASYMSPEQARGAEVVPASDLYAVGVIMFEMLTGRLPFVGEDPLSVIYQHTSEDPPDPRAINEAIPVHLAAIVLKALAKTPGERFSSAIEMRAAIDDPALGEELTRLMPAGPPRQRAAASHRPRPPRRPVPPLSSSPARRFLTLLPLALVAIVIAAVAIAGLPNGSDEDTPGNAPVSPEPTEPAAITDAANDEEEESSPPPDEDPADEEPADPADEQDGEGAPPDEADPPEDTTTDAPGEQDPSEDTAGNQGNNDQGANRYPVQDAGAVIVRQNDGRLSVVQINPAGGWDHRVEKDEDDEVIVEFMSDNREVEFRLKRENGALEVEFEDLHGLATGGTYAVGYAGEVDVFIENDGLVLGEVRPAEGWSNDVASNDPDDIEIIFRQGEYEASFEADLVNGGFELTIKALQLLN